MIRYAVSLCALATLAACGDAAPPPAEKGATAIQGDVQKGSISDEMIALDELTSSAPPVKIVPTEGGADEGGDGVAASAAPTSAESSAEPAAPAAAAEEAPENAE